MPKTPHKRSVLICERQRKAQGTMADNGSKAAHYNELHVIFDFFTDNPQKVLPLSDSNHSDNPFYDPYWGSIRAMQQNDQFLEGMLLRSVDPTGELILVTLRCHCNRQWSLVEPCLRKKKYCPYLSMNLIF